MPVMTDIHAASRGSYDEIIERAESALGWLVSKGVRVDATRARKLVNNIRKLSTAHGVSKQQTPSLAALWEIAELDDLIQIAEQLKHIDEPKFLATLAKVTSGPHLLDEESTTGGSIQGRNATFELFAAARFARAGLPVRFKSDADATIETPFGDLALECKRVAVPDKLERNILEAASQIRRRMSMDAAVAGIACISISRLVHQVASDGRDIIVADTREFQERLRVMLAELGAAIVERCRDLGPSTIAIALHFKMPFIDMNTGAPTIPSRFMVYSLLKEQHPPATLALGAHVHRHLHASVR